MLLNDFFVRLQNLRRSQNTIESYRNSLNQWLPNGDIVLTPEHIDKRMAELKHLSANSLKVRLVHLGKFLEFVHKKEPVEHYEELMDICRSTKVQQKVPEIITKDQLQVLMEAIDNLRDKAMVKTLATTGLRVSELTNLRMADLKSDHVIVREPKNNKERLVYLPKCTLELLQQYIQVYKPKDYLFVALKGTKPISRNTVEQMLNRLGTKVGLKVHPHMLRRYYATAQAKHGVPVGVLQKNMGHSSPSMSIYYTNIVMEDQKESAEVFEE